MVNAKTFLEKRYNDELELEDAVHTALLTLKEGFEGAMDHTNIEVGIVGADKTFKVLTPAEIKDYLGARHAAPPRRRRRRPRAPRRARPRPTAAARPPPRRARRRRGRVSAPGALAIACEGDSVARAPPLLPRPALPGMQTLGPPRARAHGAPRARRSGRGRTRRLPHRPVPGVTRRGARAGSGGMLATYPPPARASEAIRERQHALNRCESQ
jgi:hypothetical protein